MCVCVYIYIAKNLASFINYFSLHEVDRFCMSLDVGDDSIHYSRMMLRERIQAKRLGLMIDIGVQSNYLDPAGSLFFLILHASFPTLSGIPCLMNFSPLLCACK